MKDAGGLTALGGDAYLPLLYATGPLSDALEKLRAIDAGGALSSRIQGLEAIAKDIGNSARVTLDPTERHGFEYQSWFGFTLYADGIRGALGRGGTYKIGGSDEPATGFTLYVDQIIDAARQNEVPSLVYLAKGHDPAKAAQLRAEGFRTLASITDADDPAALGCTHALNGSELTKL